MAEIQAWAALEAGAPLSPYRYDPGPLGVEEVEVAVEHCGICHSDISIVNNDWGVSHYPVVPGHEIIGRIAALGPNARGLSVGQRVGIGWTSESCLYCESCLAGEHQLCAGARATIVGHHGGFADRVRAHWLWATPIPEALDPALAGPLLCAGATVFNPLLGLDVKPTDRVGVIGIGGLGHLALQFARAWGCEVTAFTSTAAKADEARRLGAHRVIASNDSDAIRGAANTFDYLLMTVNVPLDWSAYVATLRKHGRFALVGAVLEPIHLSAVELFLGAKVVAGSVTAGPGRVAKMLDFAARHGIAPQVERFPLKEVNAAMAHLASGKARYRIVLDVAGGQ
jgi:alcohol/geraniol dehydrogenase (NADP+)